LPDAQDRLSNLPATGSESDMAKLVTWQIRHPKQTKIALLPKVAHLVAGA